METCCTRASLDCYQSMLWDAIGRAYYMTYIQHVGCAHNRRMYLCTTLRVAQQYPCCLPNTVGTPPRSPSRPRPGPSYTGTRPVSWPTSTTPTLAALRPSAPRPRHCACARRTCAHRSRASSGARPRAHSWSVPGLPHKHAIQTSASRLFERRQCGHWARPCEGCVDTSERT